MITSLLITLLINSANFVFGLLPTSGLPVAITTGLSNFLQYVYQFNGIFPIDTAFTLLGYTAIFWGIILLFDFGKWFIHLIRGN